MAAGSTDRAPAGGGLVARTVGDRVAGAGLKGETTGSDRLKGVPEEWQLYGVA